MARGLRILGALTMMAVYLCAWSIAFAVLCIAEFAFDALLFDSRPDVQFDRDDIVWLATFQATTALVLFFLGVVIRLFLRGLRGTSPLGFVRICNRVLIGSALPSLSVYIAGIVCASVLARLWQVEILGLAVFKGLCEYSRILDALGFWVFLGGYVLSWMPFLVSLWREFRRSVAASPHAESLGWRRTTTDERVNT